MSEGKGDRGGEGARLLVIPGGAKAGDRADDALLKAFLVGDESAFAELFRRHEPMVFAIARRYARRPEDGRDLTQRAFLRALEAARRGLSRAWGRKEPFPFRAWLVRIAVNLGKNHARDEARWQRVPLEVLDGTGTGGARGGAGQAAAEAERARPASAEEALLRAERERQMRTAVLRLPRRQREVVTLRLDAELPFAEIGEVLGITENDAKVHFHYAARRLRDLLAEAKGGEP